MMEKEFHLYLGKFYNDGKELGILLYILMEKNSEFDINSAFSILKQEGFEEGEFYKVGKKYYNDIYSDENFKEYFELALEFGYCIVKYT